MALTTVQMGMLGTESQYTGFKNRIINGDMRIDQRNAGASVTATATGANTYTLDRWAYIVNAASKMSIQQNAGAVTPPNGFSNYLGVTSLSAYTVGASEQFSVLQMTEGLNTADLAWGTASAQSVTVSFWVRSSLTGTFSIVLKNSANNRSYPAAYTINSANTWEYKTIVVPGDTSGTWLTTNSIGIRLYFSVGCGSTLAGTSGSWAGADYYGAAGTTSVVGTNGATFYITGVQLEKGSNASAFDFRSYGTELSLCQRYLPCFTSNSSGNTPVATGYWNGTTQANYTFYFPVTPRVPPTGVSTTGSFFCNNPGVANPTATSIAFASSSYAATNINANVASSGGSAGVGSLLYFTSATSQIQFTGCEL